jgi:hypothetical protein
MNTVLNLGLNPMLEAGPDELTLSMAAVDAAAARAALAPQPALVGVDLDHPAAAAVLAAVVAAGWRPPTTAGGSGILTHAGRVPSPPGLFGDLARWTE